MTLKKSILKRINNLQTRLLISQKLNISEQMTISHIRRNAINGRLTMMDALWVIKTHLNEEATTPEDRINTVEDLIQLPDPTN